MKTKLLILLTMLFACVMQVKGEVVTTTDQVFVGNGTSTERRYVLCPYYGYSGSQSLYTSSEIGMSGYITEIAYQVATGGEKELKGRLRIYMAETNYSKIDNDNRFTSAEEMVLVYDSEDQGYTTPIQAGWETFTLTTPFRYSGIGNLIVATEVEKTSYLNNLYYYYTSTPGRSIYQSKDNNASYASAFTPVSESGFTTTGHRLNTRFTIESTKRNVETNLKDSQSRDYVGPCPYYGYSGSQTLYTKAEIGQAGTISEIAFNVKSTDGKGVTGYLKIYMAETSNATLIKENMFTSKDDMVLVYDSKDAGGYKTPTTTGWETFVLTKPFAYGGEMNLVIALEVQKEGWSEVYYYSSSAVSDRAIMQRADNSPSYGSAFAEASSNTFKSAYVPDIRFTFSKEYEPFIWGNDVSNNTYLGFSGRYTNVASQTLYLSEEIGQSGYISHLSYQIYEAASALIKDHIKVYMKEVPSTQTTLVATNKLSVEDMTLVYEGNMIQQSASVGDWVGVGLPTPFYYSGKGNLVIAISNTNQNVTTSNKGYNFRATRLPQRSLGTSSSSNPNDVGICYEMPITRFMFAGCVHNCMRYLVNTVCSKCGSEPTTLSGDIMLTDYDAYTRKNGVSVDGTLSMFLGNLKTNLWRPLYIPFRSYYQGSNENRYYVAKVQDFGVAQDTNGDGVVDSRDERFLTAIFLEDGSYIEPNTPYLIWPMDRYLTLRSSDNRLYPATVNELDLSTMKESFVIKGSYETQPLSVDNLKYLESEDNMYFASTTDYSGPFSWVPEYTMKNGDMVRDHVGTFVHRLGLALNDGISFTTTDPFWCDKVSYTRKSEVITTHNWQGVLVPFEVTVKHNAGSEYPKYATFAGVKTNANGEEEFTLDILKEGDVIPAATPFLMCVDEEDTDLVLENSSVLLHYPSSDAITFDTENASYSISGTTVLADNLGDEWYAISRYDGMFHPASAGAVLPRYRIYMKLQTKNGKSASELRFVFREASDETAIDHVDAVMAPDAIYTLDGRKVQEESLQPGIYVKNGKKISIRK